MFRTTFESFAFAFSVLTKWSLQMRRILWYTKEEAIYVSLHFTAFSKTLSLSLLHVKPFKYTAFSSTVKLSLYLIPSACFLKHFNVSDCVHYKHGKTHHTGPQWLLLNILHFVHPRLHDHLISPSVFHSHCIVPFGDTDTRVNYFLERRQKLKSKVILIIYRIRTRIQWLKLTIRKPSSFKSISEQF